LKSKLSFLNLYSGGIKLPKFIFEDLFNKDNHLKKINYLNPKQYFIPKKNNNQNKKFEKVLLPKHIEPI
jgi:hypothetical protein